jgi:hypothetical protein
MRRFTAPALLVAAIAVGFALGRMLPGGERRGPRPVAAPAAAVARADARTAVLPRSGPPSSSPSATGSAADTAASPGAGVDTLAQRYADLAARARDDAGAALELVRELDACARVRETRAIMTVIARDAESPGDVRCKDDAECARLDSVYDEFRESIERLRRDEPRCHDLPPPRLEERGPWLERAAELGDTEAMVCYALAGAELAPPPSDERWGPWMDRWRRTAMPWAWEAWRRGDVRAALALARTYGPDDYWRGGADDLTPADVRLEYRFALLLTRALDLEPGTSDLARTVIAAAESLNPGELALAGDAVDADLERVRRARGLPFRTPEGCWQHFAIFERAP